jgi:thioesterase domain-containing protein
MLLPIRTSGANPPLFIVHGLNGIMAIGHFLAEMLPPDRPIYAINASGMDGSESNNIIKVEDMALTYVEEIINARPSGPLLVAGLCTGSLVALEVVRELQARGREVGPVILIDPPTVPPGYLQHNHTIDPRAPLVASRLYQQVRTQLLYFAAKNRSYMPFVADDQKKVHLATLAGVNCLAALSTYVPKVFPGAATAILSFDRAAGFFHPEMFWIKILPERPMTQVLSYNHYSIFRTGRHELVRALDFVLSFPLDSKSRAGLAAESALTSA